MAINPAIICVFPVLKDKVNNKEKTVKNELQWHKKCYD